MLKQIVLMAAVFCSFSVLANNNDVPKDTVQLGVQSFRQGNKDFLSLSYKNHPKWHTYWKNPGDAGLPIKTKFMANGTEIKFNELEWPVPHRFIEEGNMWAYGYEGEYTLFFEIPDSTLESLEGKLVEVQSSWLVCKHICIPGQYSIKGRFDNGEFQAENNQLEVPKEELTSRLGKLPEEIPFPSHLDLVLAKTPGKESLVLYYNLSNTNRKRPESDRNILTPFPISPFTFTHEEVFKDSKGDIYAKFPIDWDGEYTEPEVPFPSTGKFQAPYELKFLFSDPLTSKVNIIKKQFTEINLTVAASSENFLKMLNPIPITGNQENENGDETATPVESSDKKDSLVFYLLFAFVGGLILNIMPCVLPVISLKLFSLIQHSSESRKRVFKHNMVYSLGVLFSFFVMALGVFALKAAGETVGWGFQLQSPLFVAFMIIILFAMALNLFGLYEFRTPGGRTLGGVDLKEGFTGDFFSGVLATILSTPCSAPFLGTALTFAFTSSNITILGIFLMIGVGLASPFILTGLFPSLISFLPKPGMWMENVKKFLGLTLLLTMVWLADVYISLISGTLPFLKLATIITLIFFAFYFRAKISKKLFWNVAFFGLPLFFMVNLALSPLQTGSGGESQLLADKRSEGLLWEKFSQEKLDGYKEQRELVFIDFTAKWCFTCKVNERLVLNTDGFKELAKNRNLQLLLGDWTKRDKVIGDWLKAHGMVGVPAYFIQKRDGTLVNLGETISLTEIKEHL